MRKSKFLNTNVVIINDECSFENTIDDTISLVVRIWISHHPFFIQTLRKNSSISETDTVKLIHETVFLSLCISYCSEINMNHCWKCLPNWLGKCGFWTAHWLILCFWILCKKWRIGKRLQKNLNTVVYEKKVSTVMFNNSTNINKANNWSPFTSNHWTQHKNDEM